MNKNTRTLIGIMAIILLAAAAFNLAHYFQKQATMDSCGTSKQNCEHEQELNFLNAILPFLLAAAFAFGAGIFYFMSGKVETMSDKVETAKQSLKRNTDVLLKLLNPEERKVVNLLVENNGKILQAEATRLPGMTKVKSHRIIRRLLDRGVIETEKLGKTKIIRFTKEIKEGLE